MTILNTTWDFLMNLHLYIPLPVMGTLITFGRFGVPLVAGLVETWNEYWTYSDRRGLDRSL